MELQRNGCQTCRPLHFAILLIAGTHEDFICVAFVCCFQHAVSCCDCCGGLLLSPKAPMAVSAWNLGLWWTISLGNPYP